MKTNHRCLTEETADCGKSEYQFNTNSTVELLDGYSICTDQAGVGIDKNTKGSFLAPRLNTNINDNPARGLNIRTIVVSTVTSNKLVMTNKILLIVSKALSL